jgi:hypothetical protein
MKNLGKLVVLGAALAVSAPFAHAGPVSYSSTGNINGLGSSETFGVGANTLTLSFAGVNSSVNAPTNASAGVFTASVTGAGASASGNFSLDITQTVPGAGSGSFLGVLSGTFTVNSSTGDVDFSNTVLNLDGIIYTLQQPPGGYALVPQNTNGGQTTIQMNITPAVPEPNSLTLLGMGLLGGALLLMRHRQNA